LHPNFWGNEKRLSNSMIFSDPSSMYVYMYVCMYVCMHACIYVCVYVCIACLYSCPVFPAYFLSNQTKA
jgi:hypothetical protein